MVVSDVMTAHPATVRGTESIRAVIRKLIELDVRHLPVVEDGELVGIVSDRDLRNVASRLLDEGEARPGGILDRPIADVMSADVLAVGPEAELDEVVDLMIEHRVGALPVISPGSQDLVGIISYVDVLRAARDHL
jgi:acetoin utilization protein AcuB